ncbi:MAG: YciI family protein [Demequina sp.]
MATWTIEYVYDERSEARDLHRPTHREYLAALADEGTMLGYGRYDDESAPGALLVCEADSRADVESIVAGDPFVAAALVPEYRIRRWAATFAKSLSSRLEA